MAHLKQFGINVEMEVPTDLRAKNPTQSCIEFIKSLKNMGQFFPVLNRWPLGWSSGQRTFLLLG